MTAQIWWIIQKDLLSEWRSQRAWPAMILLGIVAAMVFAAQMDLPPEHKLHDGGGPAVGGDLLRRRTEPRPLLRPGTRGWLLAGPAALSPFAVGRIPRQIGGERRLAGDACSACSYPCSSCSPTCRC